MSENPPSRAALGLAREVYAEITCNPATETSVARLIDAKVAELVGAADHLAACAAEYLATKQSRHLQELEQAIDRASVVRDWRQP